MKTSVKKFKKPVNLIWFMGRYRKNRQFIKHSIFWIFKFQNHPFSLLATNKSIICCAIRLIATWFVFPWGTIISAHFFVGSWNSSKVGLTCNWYWVSIFVTVLPRSCVSRRILRMRRTSSSDWEQRCLNNFQNHFGF